MITSLSFGKEARNKMLEGINELADAVKATLGPFGKNVAIRVLNAPDAPPKLTKDGAEVARTINFKDPTKDMGAQLIKEAALKTMYMAGDGTTTATILSQAIINKGLESLDAGENPLDLKKGMEKALEVVSASLKNQAKMIGASDPEVKQIATISANDETIGAQIADARKKIGVSGHIWLRHSPNTETYIDLVEGLTLSNGYISPAFITHQLKATCEYDDCYILVYDKKISDLRDIEKFLNLSVNEKKPILIIAEDVDGEALSTMVMNKVRGGCKFAAVKAPVAGLNLREMLEDIAAMTGATLITSENGMKLTAATKEHLGKCKQVTITKTNTILSGGHGDPVRIQERKDQAMAMMNDTEHQLEKERQRLRVARLNNGIAVMYVGANSDVEMGEKQMRCEDALLATKAALEEGVIPGGGVAYIRALHALSNIDTTSFNGGEFAGLQIVKHALKEPTTQLLLNAGREKDYLSILSTLSKKAEHGEPIGYNPRVELFENFFEEGIIDPCRVGRVALENAISVASMFLTTQVAICNAE